MSNEPQTPIYKVESSPFTGRTRLKSESLQELINDQIRQEHQAIASVLWCLLQRLEELEDTVRGKTKQLYGYKETLCEKE